MEAGGGRCRSSGVQEFQELREVGELQGVQGRR